MHVNVSSNKKHSDYWIMLIVLDRYVMSTINYNWSRIKSFNNRQIRSCKIFDGNICDVASENNVKIYRQIVIIAIRLSIKLLSVIFLCRPAENKNTIVITLHELLLISFRIFECQNMRRWRKKQKKSCEFNVDVYDWCISCWYFMTMVWWVWLILWMKTWV